MANQLFKKIYYVLAMFYVAKMVVLWLIFFIPSISSQVNYMIVIITVVLLFLIKQEYFDLFIEYINSKSESLNLVIFSWVGLSGLVTLYGFLLILIAKS